ncbi:SPFH domain-containing protein [Nocardioides limicola]|uniref:SPFH domain-containing protein n=1 Tax=Nocardioides limicola TaxID=2803368 RepID=UPI00193B5750|nr:SPFH domain-containing protein [Nocardioides sp. DJM-14]
MADITRYPFRRHLRGNATTHIQVVRRGKVAKQGVGASFWFRPLSTVLTEVPVDDRELPLFFHAWTADFQDLTVQATVSFRFADPALVARRVDFSIDQVDGVWRSNPLDQVAGLLTETAQQYALDQIAGSTLTEAMRAGVGPVRDAIAAGLGADERLEDTGIAVIGVRVVALRPEPELEKALLTPTREQVQIEADRAMYERRAVAVERERAIGENELQTQIELARREQQLVAQRGTNAQREATERAAADRIAVESEADRVRAMADAHAEAERTTGLALAEADAARLEAYRDLPEHVLLGLALKELASQLPQIDHLVLTPDLLAPVLARIGVGRPVSAGVGPAAAGES